MGHRVHPSFAKIPGEKEIAATPTPLTPLCAIANARLTPTRRLRQQEEGGQKLRELLFNQVRLRGLRLNWDWVGRLRLWSIETSSLWAIYKYGCSLGHQLSSQKTQ